MTGHGRSVATKVKKAGMSKTTTTTNPEYYVFTNTTERNDVITDENGHIQYENTLKYRFSKSIDYDGEIVVDNIVSVFEDDKINKYVVKEISEDSITVKNHKVPEKKLLLSDRNYLWYKTVRIKNDLQED